MTKRELVKWLQKRQTEAVEEAQDRKDTVLDNIQNSILDKIHMNERAEEMYPLISKLRTVFDKYVEDIKGIEGAAYNRYGMDSLYRGFLNLETIEELQKMLKESTSLYSVEEYRETRRKLISEVEHVEFTYDTVIQTVQNLPNAKAGLEYLQKLGFNLSEIKPEKEEVKLPATIDVNVNTKYLLLNQKKED